MSDRYPRATRRRKRKKETGSGKSQAPLVADKFVRANPRVMLGEKFTSLGALNDNFFAIDESARNNSSRQQITLVTANRGKSALPARIP